MVEHLSDEQIAQAVARRARLPQGLRGVQGGPRARRPADRDPGPHDQGLDARQGLRGAQRHPPDEEADQGRAQGVPRPALPADPRRGARGGPAAVLPPGRGLRRDPVHASSGGARSAASCRSGSCAPSRCRCPGDRSTTSFRQGSGKQPVATTMAFVRLLKDLMKDKEIGERFVPIIPDEARTFGMDSLFPTAKIYSPHGQPYEAGRPRPAAVLQGVRARPDPARGHQRGRARWAR